MLVVETKPRSFRLTEQDRERLAKLQDALGGEQALTETEALRWALVALEGLLDHGLAEWTADSPSDRRYISLTRPPGLSLVLVENEAGGFTPWHLSDDIQPSHTWPK